jgi:hypothetical protein
MLAFLDAGERSDVVSVRGQLDTGFVIQSTGTIPHRAVSALDELVSVGYATAGGHQKGYEITPLGREQLAAQPAAKRKTRQSAPAAQDLFAEAP